MSSATHIWMDEATQQEEDYDDMPDLIEGDDMSDDDIIDDNGGEGSDPTDSLLHQLITAGLSSDDTSRLLATASRHSSRINDLLATSRLWTRLLSGQPSSMPPTITSANRTQNASANRTQNASINIMQIIGENLEHPSAIAMLRDDQISREQFPQLTVAGHEYRILCSCSYCMYSTETCVRNILCESDLMFSPAKPYVEGAMEQILKGDVWTNEGFPWYCDIDDLRKYMQAYYPGFGLEAKIVGRDDLQECYVEIHLGPQFIKVDQSSDDQSSDEMSSVD